MTAQAKPGVPARDRPGRAPPLPKQIENSNGKQAQDEGRKVAKLEGEQEQDESDPVWLKDKADELMVQGDYQ